MVDLELGALVLGFGVSLRLVERRDLSIEIRDRLFEHRAMRRRGGVLEIRLRPGAREREGGARGAASRILVDHARLGRTSIRSRVLLRFN